MKTKNLTKNKNLDEKEENSRGFFMPERATLGALSCQKEQGSSVFPQGFFLSEGGPMTPVYISPAIRSVWFLKGSGWHIKKQTGPVYHYYKRPNWKKRIIMAVVVILTLLICVGIARAQDYTDTQIVEAIYKAEGGAKATYAYGIRSVKYDTVAEARRICFNTVRNNRKRFAKQTKYADFLEFLASRYCPVGCDNDRGTNKYWVKNVRHFLGVNHV